MGHSCTHRKLYVATGGIASHDRVCAWHLNGHTDTHTHTHIHTRTHLELFKLLHSRVLVILACEEVLDATEGELLTQTNLRYTHTYTHTRKGNGSVARAMWKLHRPCAEYSAVSLLPNMHMHARTSVHTRAHTKRQASSTHYLSNGRVQEVRQHQESKCVSCGGCVEHDAVELGILWRVKELNHL